MMKVTTNHLFYIAVRLFGTRLKDVKTGEDLGRAIVIVIRGNIWVLGYSGEVPLVPVWYEEDRVRYWRSRLGFTKYSDTSWDEG